MKDDLKTLFDNYQPALGDGDEYMLRLRQKMDATEGIKRYAEEQRRLYRRRMAIAFAVGAVMGAATVVYTLLHPTVLLPMAGQPWLTTLLLRIRPLLTVLAIAAVSVSLSVLLTAQPTKASRFSRSTP